MTVPTTDAREYNPLLDLTPRNVQAFLAATGWELAHEVASTSQIWENAAAGTTLMLPLDRTFRDFSIRFNDALSAISHTTNTWGEALALEIASASSDILLLRADQATRAGTIPLREAQTLLEGARKMIEAAACSAVRPRGHTTGRRPDRVNDFMGQEVRMGHTLRGSFVITIFADISDATTQARAERGPQEVAAQSDEPGVVDMGEASTPFGRRVFKTLATGLAATNRVLAEDTQPDMEAAISEGVSAELIEALADMSQPAGLRALDVAFRWSPSEERMALPPESSRVVVPRANVAQAASVVSRLKRRPELSAKEIIGYVIRLERSHGQEEGVAVVEGTFDNPQIGSRLLRIPLRGGQYRNAIRAHEQRYPVVVSGNLVQSPAGYVAEGLTTIRRVLEPPQVTL